MNNPKKEDVAPVFKVGSSVTDIKFPDRGLGRIEFINTNNIQVEYPDIKTSVVYFDISNLRKHKN